MKHLNLILTGCIFLANLFVGGVALGQTQKAQPALPKWQIATIDDVHATIEKNKGLRLVATQNGKLAWYHQLKFGTEQTHVHAQEITGVTKHKGLFVYCDTTHLYFAQPQGKIVKHVVLPEHCMDIQSKNDVLRVKIGRYNIKKDQPGFFQKWIVVDEQYKSGVPFSMTSIHGFFRPHIGLTQSEKGILTNDQSQRETRQAYGQRLRKERPEEIQRLKDFLVILKNNAQVDPTNPWAIMNQVEIYTILGQEKAAKTKITELLDWRGTHAFELIRISTHMDNIDHKAADTLFHRGMKDLLKRGYTPTGQSLIVPIVLLGKSQYAKIGKVELNKDRALYEVNKRRALRWREIGPQVEGIADYWYVMANAAKHHKDTKAEAIFTQLEKDARPFVLLGTPKTSARYLGILLNAYLAWLMAFILLIAVKMLRIRHTKVSQEASKLARFNPFARWHRAELISLLCMPLILFFIVSQIMTTTTLVGTVADAPSSILSEMYGTERAQSFLKKINHPQAKRMKAMGLVQQNAPLAEIEKAYETLQTPQDLNNLGLAYYNKGKLARAQALWQKAVKQDPKLKTALHNLGKPITNPSFQIEQLHRYNLQTQKVLDYPSLEQEKQLWVAHSKSNNGIDGSTTLGRMKELTGTDAANWLWVFLLMIIVAATLGLFVRGEVEETNPHSKIDTVLAAIVPGSSRYYSVFGFFFGTFVFTFFRGFILLRSTDGRSSNLFTEIAIGSYGTMFGVEISPKPIPYYDMLSMSWYMFILINVVFVVAMWLYHNRRTTN